MLRAAQAITLQSVGLQSHKRHGIWKFHLNIMWITRVHCSFAEFVSCSQSQYDTGVFMPLFAVAVIVMHCQNPIQ